MPPLVRRRRSVGLGRPSRSQARSSICTPRSIMAPPPDLDRSVYQPVPDGDAAGAVQLARAWSIVAGVALVHRLPARPARCRRSGAGWRTAAPCPHLAAAAAIFLASRPHRWRAASHRRRACSAFSAASVDGQVQVVRQADADDLDVGRSRSASQLRRPRGRAELLHHRLAARRDEVGHRRDREPARRLVPLRVLPPRASPPRDRRPVACAM